MGNACCCPHKSSIDDALEVIFLAVKSFALMSVGERANDIAKIKTGELIECRAI